MSVNQSRAEKSESHYKKSGRSGSSGNQRSFSGGGGGGKGGGGNAAPTPPQSSTHRSYRKSNNGPGGQPRVNNSDVNISSSAARPGQNGAHVQVQPHPQPPVSGVSDAPVVAAAGAGAAAAAAAAAAPGVVGKPTNAPAPRSSRPVPKAPSSQSTPPADTAAPSTPAKADGSKGSGFPLQFGSLSPGFMNGMQIPARTSSAPPNLDEQKRDQARHDSFRAVPTMPIPSAPKQQQQPVKDAGSIKQGNSGESNAIQAAPQVKRDVHSQGSVSPAATVTQKPSAVPLGMSMPMPFQSQVPVPFGHNSQIQSQGGTAPSMQVQMSAGNAGQLQQQVFVPGMQSHQLQTQGMIPQGQGLNFPPQIGHQLPPQMGNMGIGMGSPFAQQQAAKFGGPRKTVKITHPDTHEELTLDKRTATYMDGSLSGTRPHPNLPPQSQPIPSFASAHPLPFFPPSFNPPPMFFAPQTSVPLTSTQMTPGSQPTRYNYTVGQGLPNLSFMNPPLSQLPVLKTGPSLHGVAEPLNVEHHHDAQAAPGSVSSASVQVTVKPVVSSHGEKVGSSSVIVSSPVGKSESPKLLRPSKEASMSHLHKDSETGSESQLLGSVSEPSVAVKHSPTSSASVTVSVQKLSPISASSSPSEESASVVTNTEGRRKETVKRSDSFKDHQKKQARKDTRHSQPQQQEDASDNSKPSSMAMPREVVKGPDNIKSPSEVVASSLASAAHASVESSRGALGSGGDQMPDTCASASTSDVGSDVIRKEDEGLPSEDITGTVEQGKTEQDKGTKIDRESVEVTAPASQPSVVELASNLGEMSVSKESGSLEPESEKNEGPIGHHSSEVDRMDDNLTRPNAISSDSVIQDGITPPLDGLAVRSEKSVDQDLVTMNSGLSQQELPPASLPIPADSASKQGAKVAEVAQSAPVSTSAPGSKEKPVELNRTKSSTARGKKKRKDILKAADAAGSTSDLYMAYKGPEEKQETVISSGNMDQSSNFIVKQEPAHVESDVQEDGQSKAEPDDWEDAADISTPKLKPSGKHSHAEEDGNGTSGKKYTRDFLLTLSEHWNELPSNFEIGADIADTLMSVQVGTSHLVDREPYSNSGRVIDRSGGGPRPDRRGSGIVDDDKWSKSPGPFPQGRDPRMDVHGNVTGFRSGPGGNHGVLRNPRGQPTGPYVGGILPMQSLANQGGMHRSNSDADRWQRAKGLIPSPQSPAQMMHKAEKKYEVGKVSDEEQAKQRQLKAILNKLTPQNFEKLFEKVKEVNIDNAVTLTGIISQIFDKALMEPTFCEMYANFCFHLSGDLPDFFEDNEKINFKRLLLNKCQEEFERGEREQAEADRVEEEGEVKCSEEEREEKRVQARRRMLGNIRLIGELYKKKMLTERIMHECIKKLLGQPQNPDEEDIESLCKLMSTIGEMIDHSKAKEHMDRYFDIMFSLSNNMTLSSRVRFMLKDSIDLRRNKWQQRRKVEGPKKIDEVHRDAAQERQAQASRLARGPNMSSSGRRGQPMDFAPRGSSMISSPNSQMGGLRGYAPQNRGYAAQDARFEERHNPYDSRMLSALSQRPIDEPITLGPQGGLARGMSGRGDPIISSVPLVDMSRTPGDSRRMGSGPNGYSSSADWTQHNAREEVSQRYSERHVPSPVYDHLHPQERHAYVGNRDLRSTDRSIDRPMASAVTRVQGSSNSSAAPPAATEKVWPEDRLRDMSIATIREFYSAKDKDEVALCIKDLNSPSFYPSMVSIWVTDSFERKDMERDLLARLLVDLTKPRDSLLSEIHLKKGFESVLATLEDAVNDAPKAAEFLGRILAKVILENVVPLGEIGRLIHEGGEEPGRLLEVGLASEVLGSILEIIRSEKGDSVLNEIRFASNLRLEDFRPPDPIKSRKLEAFI